MTRIVGHQNRSEFILDPAEAIRRGAVLDQLGPQVLPPRPRGVMRAKHVVFNTLDDQRQLELAKILNATTKTVNQERNAGQLDTNRTPPQVCFWW